PADGHPGNRQRRRSNADLPGRRSIARRLRRGIRGPSRIPAAGHRPATAGARHRLLPGQGMLPDPLAKPDHERGELRAQAQDGLLGPSEQRERLLLLREGTSDDVDSGRGAAMTSNATTVEEYLAALPEERRAALSAVREVILASLPEGYEETMQ